MAGEARECQNCRKSFAIEPEDLDFYGKIGVPAPTFCPECRMQRRMAWRNERTLYKRKCDAPGHTEDIISMYAPGTPYHVVDTKYWWGDGWNPIDSGTDYDLNVPFFKQFSDLLKRTPLLALSNLNSVGSDYTNFVDNNKNCYLVFGSFYNENVAYSNKTYYSKDSLDLMSANRCELCYECVDCTDSFKLRWSRKSKNCTDSWFLYNCRGCTSCFGCANLVNRSFHIFNQPYSKEEYQKKLEALIPTTRAGVDKVQKEIYEKVYLTAVHRYANIMNSANAIGDNIYNSKNVYRCFDIYDGVEDSKYLYHSLSEKDAYDGVGQYKTDLSYENVDNDTGNKNIGTLIVYSSNNVNYSFNCHSCNNCFGCTGLRQKQYCILNKQYSKEEYEALVPKIISQMKMTPYVDAKGRKYDYGDFFPIEISPFAYNGTIAQEYFPLTKEETLAKGYMWREPETKNYQVTKRAADLSAGIAEVDDGILKETVGCSHEGKCSHQCTTAFKITAQELQFYRKMNLPLPELCPNCRHYERLAQRNPLKLWHRTCQCAGRRSENGVYQNTVEHGHGDDHCPNEFETSYAPDRPEIVYCEECHQREVS